MIADDDETYDADAPDFKFGARQLVKGAQPEKGGGGRLD